MANIINIFSNTKYEMNDSSSCCIIGQLVRQFINLSPDLSLKFNNVVFMDETEADRCVTKSFIERFNEYIYLYRSADDPTPMKCRFNGKTDQLPKLEVVKYASTGISENDDYDMNQLINVSDVRAYVPARKIKMTMMNVDLPESVVLDYKTKTASQKEIVSQIVNRKVAPFIYRYTLPEKYTDSSVPDTDVTIDITLDSATNVKNVYVSADIPSTSKSYSNQYVPMLQNGTTNTTYGENKNLLVKVENKQLSFEMNNIPDNIDLLITGYTNELYSYSVCGNYLVSIRDENNTTQYIMADNTKINGSERHSDDTSATYGNTPLYDPDDNYISPQSWATTPINSNNINITAYIDTNYVSRLYLKGIIVYTDADADYLWPSNIDNTQGGDWTNWSLPGVSTLNINGNIKTKPVAYINIFAYGATQTINVKYVNTTIYDEDKLKTQQVIITYNNKTANLYKTGTTVSFNLGTICDVEISYAGTLEIYTQLLCNGKVMQTVNKSEIENNKIKFTGVKLTDEYSELSVRLYSYVTKRYNVSWTKTWPNMYSAYNLYNKYENVNSDANYNYLNIINITNPLSTTVSKINSTYESELGENNVNVAVVENNFSHYNFPFGNKKYLFFNNYVESFNSSTKYFIEDNYNLYVNNTNMSEYQVANKEAIKDAPNYSIDITKNSTITIEARYMNKQRYIRIFTNKEIASEYVYIYNSLLIDINGRQILVKSYKTSELVKYTKTLTYDIQYKYIGNSSLNTSNTYNTFVYIVPIPDNMTYDSSVLISNNYYVVFSFDDPDVSMSETPVTREQSVLTMIKGGLTYEDFSANKERPVLSSNTIDLLQQNIYVPYHITEGNNDEAMHLMKLNVPYLYASNKNYKFIDYSIEFLQKQNENDHNIETMKIYTTRGQLYMFFDGIFYELHKYDYDDTYEPAQDNLLLNINKNDLKGEYEYRIPVKTGVPYQLYTFYFKPEYKNANINTTNYTILVDAMYGYNHSLQDADAEHLNSNVDANMAFQVEIDTTSENFRFITKDDPDHYKYLSMSIRAYIAYKNTKPQLDNDGGGIKGGYDFIINQEDKIYAEEDTDIDRPIVDPDLNLP